MKVKWNGDNILGAVESENRKAITKACFMLEREIKLSMKSTPRMIKKGRKAQKSGKYHHPSAPGYPPAVDTGRLISSISHAFSWGAGSAIGGKDNVTKPSTIKKGESIGVVGSAVEYAPHLELGTHKMKARPYLRTALIKNKDKILGFFK